MYQTSARAWTKGAEPDYAYLISTAPHRPAASRDVYCYFDNDIKVKAPFDAQSLIAKLGLVVVSASN